MRVECSCGKTLKVADTLAGKKIRCPACKAVVQVPEEAEETLQAIEVPQPAKGRPKPRPEPEEIDEEEETPPAPKNKSKRRPEREEEGEDDEPRPRRRQAKDEDEVDEAPRPRRRPARDEDDEDDEPRTRRRPARDEDDEEDQDRKAKRKEPASFMSKYGLWLGIGGGGVVAAAAAVVVVILATGGSTTKGPNAQDKDKSDKPGEFVDEKKMLKPFEEWPQQITSERGGAISLRVVSAGPFSVLLLTERGHQAQISQEKVDEADKLLWVDSKEAKLERTVAIPAGTARLLIQNKTENTVQIHLQCSPAKELPGDKNGSDKDQAKGGIAKGGTPSLAEARRAFKTRLIRREKAGEPPPMPPPEIFRVVHYESPAGKLAAYLSPKPRDGKRHPAIVWITGGDCNTIDEVWQKAPPNNDQTASAFREAGIVMMYPSLRGGNDNPGFKEGFFGEVDDVVAAGDYLARQDFVDPKRIYLGGHSTGGTLVLLAAASTDRFRAVFSFGPVDEVEGYGPEYLPFDTSNPRELELRAPVHWLHSMRNPVFVFEGADKPGNVDSLRALARASKNPLVHCHPVKGLDHFSILFPATRLIASKILRDDGEKSNLAFTENELSKLAAK